MHQAPNLKHSIVILCLSKSDRGLGDYEEQFEVSIESPGAGGRKLVHWSVFAMELGSRGLEKGENRTFNDS